MSAIHASTPGHAAAPAPVRDRLIRMSEVETMTGVRKSTIYKLMGQNKFPRCVQVTTKCVAWAESAVQKWVKDKIAETQTLGSDQP